MACKCISLEMAKKHLNIDDDMTEDDEYILGLVDASVKIVERSVNDTFEHLAGVYGDVPAPLVSAALLMLGNLYQNRETSGTKAQALPYNYDFLINLYRNYVN